MPSLCFQPRKPERSGTISDLGQLEELRLQLGREFPPLFDAPGRAVELDGATGSRAPAERRSLSRPVEKSTSGRGRCARAQ